MSFDQPVDHGLFSTIKWCKSFHEEHFGYADAYPDISNRFDQSFLVFPLFIVHTKLRHFLGRVIYLCF